MIDPIHPDYSNTPVSPGRPVYRYHSQFDHDDPSVSIVTPFIENIGQLGETARSISQQSHQQWEWLIVYGEPDKARLVEILDESLRNDHRVRMIGLAQTAGKRSAYDIGAQHARSRLIAPLAVGDLLEPTAIEKWFWFLVSFPEISLVNSYSVGFGHIQASDFCAGLIRKEAYETLRRSPEAGSPQLDGLLQVATIPEYLVWYRLEAERIESQDQSWALLGSDRIYKQIEHRYPGFWFGQFKPAALDRRKRKYPNRRSFVSAHETTDRQSPRCLMILPWLNMGGADKFNLDLIGQLGGKGWEFSIVTTRASENPWLHEFAHYTPDIFPLYDFMRYEDFPLFLEHLIRSRQINHILISNSEYGYYLLTWLTGRFPDVTFLDYTHMVEPHWLEGGYPKYSQRFQPFLDLSITSSQQVKAWMVAAGADPERIEVCYTNVDAEKWCPDPDIRRQVRQEFGLDDEMPVIIYAARICEQKQPMVLARTMKHLRDMGISFRAWVIGDGPDFEALKEFVNSQDLQEKVSLFGVLPNARVKDFLRAADIFFLPSQGEGISLGIYEAMACGLAIVGADVGGQVELVTPDTGFLITPSDEVTEVQTYAGILARLIADAGLRKSLGQAGRNRIISSFGLEQMGDQMIQLFEKAAANRINGRSMHVGLYTEAVADLLAERQCMEQGLDDLWAARGYFLNRIQELEQQAGTISPSTVQSIPNHVSWRRGLAIRLSRSGKAGRILLDMVMWSWTRYKRLY